MTDGKRSGVAAVLLAAVGSLAGGLTGGPMGSMAQAQSADAAKGRAMFQAYCAQCHGADARGNGPMAEIVAVPTPDLTALSAGNGGVFPLEAVARQIDGRARVLAHGGDMPIFGSFLDSDGRSVFTLPSGQPMMTSLPVADLLVFLETLQGQ